MSMRKMPERRQFGLLQTTHHAWIRVAGRPPVPCIVRDLSVAGAGVELTEDCALPNHFTLAIDAVGFTGTCSVRHRDGTKLGIEFVTRGAERDAGAADTRAGQQRR